MRLLLAAIILVGIASALPSDDLTYIQPPTVANLQHVNPAVAKVFDGQNAPLTAHKQWEVPNLGHYASYRKDAEQNDTELTASQAAVVGNVTNDTLVYI